MLKLIKIIENKIVSFDNLIECYESLLYKLLINHDVTHSIINNQDEINIKNLKKRVPKSFYKKLNYIEKLQGWFSKCPNESQIKKANDYLLEIMKYLIFKENRRIILSVKLLKKHENLKNQYEQLLLKLYSYNEDVNLSQEEFDLIFNSINESEIDSALLDEICKIGENNALLKIKNENLNLEIDDDFLDFFHTKKDKNQTDSSKEINILLSKIKNFLNDKTSIEIIVRKEDIINVITEIFEYILSLENITNEMYDEAKILGESSDSIYSYEGYVLSNALKIVEALEKSNLKYINDTIDIYKSESKEFKEKARIDKIRKNKIDIIKSIANEYYIEEEYLKYSSSTMNLSKEKIIELYGNEKVQSMYVMNLIYNIRNKFERMSLEELDELINILNTEIEKCINLQKITNSVEDNLTPVGLDITDVNNYIVFLSLERIENNIESIMKEHSGVNSTLFTLSLYKLMSINHNQLYARKTCKPIMGSFGKTNSYDIREERSGSLRICFKAINTKEGYIVYEILSFAYGSCDDRKKDENLKSSIKEYEEHYKEYQDFENIIKSSTLSELTTTLTNGLTLYNKLFNANNITKVGENL